MLLYHYTTTPYKYFKTLAMQRPIGLVEKAKAVEIAKFRKDPGPYYDHISFFFEKVPIDIIGTLFKNSGNTFWINGNVIYEHCIDSDSLGNFKYVIVETGIHKPLLNIWPEDDNEKDKEIYFKKLYSLNLQNNYIGTNGAKFDTVAKSFIGHTRQAYINAVKNPFEPESLRRYAADVPHVMIYPANKQRPIPILNPVIPVTIGANIL